jgi:hypothetical protein
VHVAGPRAGLVASGLVRFPGRPSGCLSLFFFCSKTFSFSVSPFLL